jgi:hypothetical protein
MALDAMLTANVLVVPELFNVLLQADDARLVSVVCIVSAERSIDLCMLILGASPPTLFALVNMLIVTS